MCNVNDLNYVSNKSAEHVYYVNIKIETYICKVGSKFYQRFEILQGCKSTTQINQSTQFNG